MRNRFLIDEKKLWAACQRGDLASFEQLYTIYFDKLSLYGKRITPDVQLIEDAIQDVFTDLWRRKEYLTEPENVKFYLFKAVRNQLVRNTRNDVFEESESIDSLLDLLVTISSEQSSIEHETKLYQTKHVQQAISQLSQRQQEAIHLRFYQGMSLNEVAQLMQLNKQSVSNLLFKAYAVLRVSLKVFSTLLLGF